MSTIRKKSILSSLVVYTGFALGFVNTYLYAREGGFTKTEYGLTSLFIAVANVMYSLGALGMPAYVSKFFPYYKDRLKPKENDMFTRALVISTMGFAIVSILGVIFKDLVLARFNNAPMLQQYYYWIFPFGYGYTLFMVLESYGWQQGVPILTNFLKELLSRILITLLIVATSFGVIGHFDTFVHLYAFMYPILALVLIVYFLRSGKAHFVWMKSTVTEKFWPKVVALCGYVWGGGLVLNLSSVFDKIVIAAVLPNGLESAAVFTLAENISSLIQAPQRGVIASAVGPLSQAWKDKDLDRINRIYHRSAINQLLFACAIFSLIWLNFEDGVYTFKLQADYVGAKWVFLFMGLYRVIDMGTGLNAQIIGTSSYWKFEFTSGLVLLAMAIPLNYFLTKELGIIGPAISSLIAFTAYNAIRFWFLYKRFGMQPFSMATLYTVLLAGLCFGATWYLFNSYQGFWWIVARSSFFSILFGISAFYLKLSPDVDQVLATVKNRLKR